MRKWAALVAAALVLVACGKAEERSLGEAPLGEGGSPVPTPHLRFEREGEPDPSATTLQLVVAAQHCIGEEQTVVDRVDVLETQGAVTVTAHLAQRDLSIARCTKGVALYAPVPVTLEAPLGNRRILDGSCSPPVDVLRQFEQRQFCEQTDEEKAEATAVGEWATFDAGPLAPRGEPKGAWNGKELIVVGGLALEQYRSLSDGAAYNPRTKTWRRIPDLPTPGRVHAVAPIRDGLLALSHPGNELSVFKGTNAHVYSATTNEWRAVPPPSALTYPRAFSTGGEVIVWGAEGGAIFDPATDAWRVIPALNMPGSTSGMANGGVSQWIADPGMLAVQGNYDPRDGSPSRSALFLFSPSTNRWRKAADPPAALGHGGSFVVATMEVFDNLDQPGQSALAYDAKNDAWRKMDTIDGDRDGGTAYFTGVDIGGGRGAVRVAIDAKPLLLLDLESGSWRHAASPGRIPAPDAVMAWTGESLLLWGRPANIKPDDRNAAWAWTPPAKS